MILSGADRWYSARPRQKTDLPEFAEGCSSWEGEAIVFVIRARFHSTSRSIERPDMIVAYAQRKTLLIHKLIAQGVDRGEWHVSDVFTAASVVRDAVTAFIHPQLLAQAIEVNAPVEDQLRATVATLSRSSSA